MATTLLQLKQSKWPQDMSRFLKLIPSKKIRHNYIHRYSLLGFVSMVPPYFKERLHAHIEILIWTRPIPSRIFIQEKLSHCSYHVCPHSCASPPKNTARPPGEFQDLHPNQTKAPRFYGRKMLMFEQGSGHTCSCISRFYFHQARRINGMPGRKLEESECDQCM